MIHLQIPSQLSSHLRALRKGKGWSQADLGQRLGLSQARVARIEGDPLSISVEQLLRVFAVLGVRMALEPVSSTYSAASINAPLIAGEPPAVGSIGTGGNPLAAADSGEGW